MRWNLKEAVGKTPGLKKRELHIRPYYLDEFASQKNPILPKDIVLGMNSSALLKNKIRAIINLLGVKEYGEKLKNNSLKSLRRKQSCIA